MSDFSLVVNCFSPAINDFSLAMSEKSRTMSDFSLVNDRSIHSKLRDETETSEFYQTDSDPADCSQWSEHLSRQEEEWLC